MLEGWLARRPWGSVIVRCLICLLYTGRRAAKWSAVLRCPMVCTGEPVNATHVVTSRTPIVAAEGEARRCAGTISLRLRDERRTGNTNRAPLDTRPGLQLFFNLPLSLSMSLSSRGRFIERVNVLVARDSWHPVTRRNRGVSVILTTHSLVASPCPGRPRCFEFIAGCPSSARSLNDPCFPSFIFGG